ncbi:MAG: DUF4112 domain-containing protein [Cyanobacteria bacterium Co-bin8]|nr:DUF4112 domain-containing protein [Cyanobacteria bacterium Co-bin8]
MNTPRPSSLPASPASARIARLRNLSYWLDNAIAIPGTRFRFGLDPIIGLLPGGGDTAGLLMSSYIVLEAARMGASKSMLSQMAFNILLETLAGTIPVAGDLFDATWKSNVRNMRLLEEHLKLPPVTRARNRWFAVLLIIGLILVLIGCVAISLLLLRWVIQQFGQ